MKKNKSVNLLGVSRYESKYGMTYSESDKGDSPRFQINDGGQ